MIPVTRLDGTQMIVNCEQIAWIEHMPDTVISLMNGEKLIVRETPEALVDEVRAFKRTLVSGAGPGSARTVHGPTEVLSGRESW
jgi:flagellar protein FlbD